MLTKIELFVAVDYREAGNFYLLVRDVSMVEAKFAVVLISKITDFIYMQKKKRIYRFISKPFLNNIFVTSEENLENKPTVEYGITDI